MYNLRCQTDRNNVYCYDVSIEHTDRAGNKRMITTDVEQSLQSMNTAFCREVLELVLANDKNFVYDGRERLYGLRPLKMAKLNLIVKFEDLKDQSNCIYVMGQFDVTIKPMQMFMLDYSKLTDKESLKFVDALTSQSYVKSYGYLQIDKHTFFEPKMKPLTFGIDYSKGFTKKIKLRADNSGKSRAMVVIKYKVQAFISSTTLLQIYVEFTRNSPKHGISQFNKRMIGTYFRCTHQLEKLYQFRQSAQPHHIVKFKRDNDNKDIAHLFKERFNVDLQFPGIFCVANNDVLLPLELCVAIKGQFIPKESLRSAEVEKLDKLEQLSELELHRINSNNVRRIGSQILEAFGVQIKYGSNECPTKSFALKEFGKNLPDELKEATKDNWRPTAEEEAEQVTKEISKKAAKKQLQIQSKSDPSKIQVK